MSREKKLELCQKNCFEHLPNIGRRRKRKYALLCRLQVDLNYTKGLQEDKLFVIPLKIMIINTYLS